VKPLRELEKQIQEAATAKENSIVPAMKLAMNSDRSVDAHIRANVTGDFPTNSRM